jgi:hypothetical protein
MKTLDEMNEKELKKELESWHDSFFTTSSEFLGELAIILKKVINSIALDKSIKKDTLVCLKAIDNAFLRANNS